MKFSAVARKAAALALAAFCVAPFLFQIGTSFVAEGDLAALGWPKSFSWESYRGALGSPGLLHAIANSALVATATTVLTLAVAASAAFAIAKLPIRGRSVLLGVALAVSMFPTIATVSPLYLLLRSAGLLDKPVGLVIPYVTFSLPLALFVLTGFFRTIPDDLYRAARVDGCSPWVSLWRVFLPLAAPGIGTTAIFVFVFAYNELLYALTFTSSPENRTIPVAITLFTAEHKEPWGQIAAASVVVTLPLLVVALVFARKIVAGLTQGAVKG